MSENNRSELLESLSAIADGEATEFELRRILREENNSGLVKEKWAEFHRVGNALRGEPASGVDISAAVMSAIEAEPKPSSVARFFKPFGQVAVAASVAAVALLGVQQYQLAQLEPAVEGTVAETQPLESNTLEFIAPEGFEILPQTSTASAGEEIRSLQIPIDRRALYEHVNESILEHSENAAEATQDIYPMLRVPTEE